MGGAVDATLQDLWRQYWSKHSHLERWHAATQRRRDQGSARVPASGSGLCQVVVRAAKLPMPPGEVELLFACVARSWTVHALSFKSAGGELRLQLGSEADAQQCAAKLSRFFGMERANGVALNTTTLRLSGAGALDTVSAVSIGDIRRLFEIFGECTVTENRTSVTIEYVNSDADAAAHDALAAVSALQLWLAFDWSMFVGLERRATLQQPKRAQPLPRLPSGTQPHPLGQHRSDLPQPVV